MKIQAWPGEDEVAVWVPGTVNTHLVSALAGDVLSAASQADCSADMLLASLLGQQHDDAVIDEEARADAAALVNGLVQAGLLRPVAAPGTSSSWPA